MYPHPGTPALLGVLAFSMLFTKIWCKFSAVAGFQQVP
jgi:hypothetical protein